MITSSEVLKLIKGLSLSDRLKIVEAILKSIREEASLREKERETVQEKNGPAILAMAGIFDEEEARVFESTVAESRKIVKS